MHTFNRFVIAAGLLALANGASAACTVNTVVGVWGFTYTALDLDGKRACAGIGLMTFATGNFSSNTLKVNLQRESCNGQPLASGSAAGTYTVASSCNGRSTNLKYTPSNKVATLEFIAVQAATKLQFVLVINGITLHGEAVKR